MTQPTPTLPTPLAVPWTPPAPAPTQPVQAAPYAMPQNGPQTGSQPVPQAQAAPHLQRPDTAAHPQFQNQAQPHHPVHPPANAHATPQGYTPHHTPTPQPAYAQTPQAAGYNPMQGMGRPENTPQFQPGQPYQAQMAHPGQPPMPQVTHPQPAHTQPAHMQPAEAPKSKSLLKSLLNRQPKPTAPDGEAKPASGSIFDKNFVFGLAAGLILGFLVLPMVFGGSSEPAPTAVAQYTAPQSTAQTDVVAADQVEGESFVDSVLASETP